MPFKSEKQRRWMHANEPEMAKKWEKEKKMKKETKVTELIRKMVREIMAEKKNKGLYHNIHAKRKRGESPAKPGDKDYPETLKFDEGDAVDKEREKQRADKEKMRDRQFQDMERAREKEKRLKKNEVTEHTVKFSKAEMAKLHKDGKIEKADNHGKMHTYIFSEGKLTEKAKRDYKAEYKKFQSSKKSKKYRAELNAYNRKKGTYGNGDGKDASHKGGKIAGFEKESVNRGRAEKSRLKKEGFAGGLDKDNEEFEGKRKKQAEVLGYTLTGKEDIKVDIGKLTEKEIRSFVKKILGEGKLTEKSFAKDEPYQVVVDAFKQLYHMMNVAKKKGKLGKKGLKQMLTITKGLQNMQQYFYQRKND